MLEELCLDILSLVYKLVVWTSKESMFNAKLKATLPYQYKNKSNTIIINRNFVYLHKACHSFGTIHKNVMLTATSAKFHR